MNVTHIPGFRNPALDSAILWIEPSHFPQFPELHLPGRPSKPALNVPSLCVIGRGCLNSREWGHLQGEGLNLILQA